MGTAIAAAAAALLSLLVAWPLLRRASPEDVIPPRSELDLRRDRLRTQRDDALDSLLDLQADRTLGRIDEGEFSRIAAVERVRAAEALQELDRTDTKDER